MESASGATYLSKKALVAYSQKRQERVEKQAKKAAKKSQKDVIQAKSEMIKPKAQSDLLDQVKEDVVMENLESKVESNLKRASSNSESSEEDEEQDLRYRSCEEVDSDELDGGLNLSDNEEEAASFRVRNKAQKQMGRARPARHYRQEIDTNVFKIEFSTLKDNAELATGDPTFCQKCQAVLNIYSKVEEVKEGDEKQIWTCEFCLTKNDVCLEEEEKPQTKAVNYIVEAAAQVQDKMAVGAKEISVVFCIDQSGSMCCSEPVQGKFKIKGDKTGGMKDLMKFSDGSDQFQQGERNVTYVSRMQCLQAAIDQQIGDMANGAADRKLGLVAFNNEVTVLGDGTQDPQIVTGDKLEDFDYLIKNGSEQGKLRMQHKIGKTSKKLTEKLMGLEETGPTALGPAVATSIAMAAEGAPGSQVVICTDGLANIGLGAFDEVKEPEQLAKVEEFYERLGEFAKQKGLTVNVVSIIGDECNLESLSKLAEMTGGNVERVDPVSLTKNFANILSEPIIASNVVAKVKLHKGLQFRNENPQWVSDDKTLLTRDIGNVTMDTEITFEYTLKQIAELAKMEDMDLTKIDRFPFQTQITYKALDGSKCIRVITSEQKVSNEREELERRADYDILGQNCMQRGAQFAKAGHHRQAQAYAKNWGRKMKTQAAVNNDVSAARSGFVERFNNLYDCMGAQDQMEQEDEAQEEIMMSRQAQPGLGGKLFAAEDADQAPKKGGIFSGLFGGFGSKAKKSQALAVPASSNAFGAGSSGIKRSSKMSDNMASACYQAGKFSNKSVAKQVRLQPVPQPKEKIVEAGYGQEDESGVKIPARGGLFAGVGQQFGQQPGQGMGDSFGADEEQEQIGKKK